MHTITVRSLEFKLFAITFTVNFFFIFKFNLIDSMGVLLFFLIPLSYITHHVIIQGKNKEDSIYTEGIIYFSLFILNILMISCSYYLIYYVDWLITGSASFSHVGGLTIASYLIIFILNKTNINSDDVYLHSYIYTFILIIVLPIIFVFYYFRFGIIPEPGNDYNLFDLINIYTGPQLLCFILIKEEVNIKLKSAYIGFIGLIIYFSIIAILVSYISIEDSVSVVINSLDLIPKIMKNWNGDVLRTLLSLLYILHYFILLEIILLGIRKLKKLLVDKKKYANEETKKQVLKKKSANNRRIYTLLLILFAIYAYNKGGNELSIAKQLIIISTSLLSIIISIMATNLSNKTYVNLISIYMILINILVIIYTLGYIQI